MVEFSGYHRLENSRFALHYSVQWIGWSEFRHIDGEKSGPVAEYNWRNGMHYAIGTTYYLNDEWTLRAGYMYDTSAQDEYTSISVPDSNRHWLSTGFTYHFTPASNVDFGFTYLIGEDVDVEEDMDQLGTHISATTHADAILFGLQYSHTF